MIIVQGYVTCWRSIPVEKSRPDYGTVVDLVAPRAFDPPEVAAAKAYFTIAAANKPKSSVDSYPLVCNLVGSKQVGPVFAEGSSFGELSLLCDTVRQATVVVESEYTNVLVVSRATWNALLRQDQQRILAEKLQYFATRSFFHTWSNARMLQFLQCVRIHSVGRNVPVCCLGQPVEKVYFLRDGEVEITVPIETTESKLGASVAVVGAHTSAEDFNETTQFKRIRRSTKSKASKKQKLRAASMLTTLNRASKSSNTTTSAPSDSTEPEEDVLGGAVKVLSKDAVLPLALRPHGSLLTGVSPLLTTVASTTPTITSSFAAVLRKSKGLQVGVLSAGDVLGEGDALMGQKYTFQAVSRTKVSMFEVSRDNFLRLLTDNQINKIRRLVVMRDDHNARVAASVEQATKDVKRSRLHYFMHPLPPMLPSTSAVSIHNAKYAQENPDTTAPPNLWQSGKIVRPVHKRAVSGLTWGVPAGEIFELKKTAAELVNQAMADLGYLYRSQGGASMHEAPKERSSTPFNPMIHRRVGTPIDIRTGTPLTGSMLRSWQEQHAHRNKLFDANAPLELAMTLARTPRQRHSMLRHLDAGTFVATYPGGDLHQGLKSPDVLVPPEPPKRVPLTAVTTRLPPPLGSSLMAVNGGDSGIIKSSQPPLRVPHGGNIPIGKMSDGHMEQVLFQQLDKSLTPLNPSVPTFSHHNTTADVSGARTSPPRAPRVHVKTTTTSASSLPVPTTTSASALPTLSTSTSTGINFSSATKTTTQIAAAHLEHIHHPAFLNHRRQSLQHIEPLAKQSMMISPRSNDHTLEFTSLPAAAALAGPHSAKRSVLRKSTDTGKHSIVGDGVLKATDGHTQDSSSDNLPLGDNSNHEGLVGITALPSTSVATLPRAHAATITIPTPPMPTVHAKDEDVTSQQHSSPQRRRGVLRQPMPMSSLSPRRGTEDHDAQPQMIIMSASQATLTSTAGSSPQASPRGSSSFVMFFFCQLFSNRS